MNLSRNELRRLHECLTCPFFERCEIEVANPEDYPDAQCSVVSGDEYNGFFRRIDCDGGYCKNKPNWCPLKEVPE